MIKIKERFITATKLYSVVGSIAIIFLMSMGIFQNVDIYKSRTESEYKIIEDIKLKEISDEDTPLGIRREYKWVLQDIGSSERCLAFYTVHQYVEVYFDEELIYSLKLQENNKIGKTTANNWIIIPIMVEDEGKEITVNIIPVYEEVLRRQPTFSIGTKFDIYANQLKIDLPQIILSFICMICGVVFVIISTFHRNKGKENANLIYLGIFSLCIGIWKLTDIRFAPLMFSKNTQVLSYISIMMISLSVVPLLLSIKKQFLNKYSRLLENISIFYCCINSIIIFLQFTNIADFRKTLWFAHMMIGIISILTVGVIIYEGKTNKINKKIKILHICLIVCILGTVIDMIVYYVQGHSSGILYTLMAFLVYIITMGCMSINDINQKASIDTHTGLYNKSRCNELLDERIITTRESLAIMMFDLNGLKYINDTFGHENGDIIISEFAKIISKNVSNRDFVGRYGGDEFIVVIDDANEIMIQQINAKILKDTEEYNMENYKMKMSYSMGYTLTIDYPECTLRELLEEADNNMYKNKNRYYKRNV